MRAADPNQRPRLPSMPQFAAPQAHFTTPQPPNPGQYQAPTGYQPNLAQQPAPARPGMPQFQQPQQGNFASYAPSQQPGSGPSFQQFPPRPSVPTAQFSPTGTSPTGPSSNPNGPQYQAGLSPMNAQYPTAPAPQQFYGKQPDFANQNGPSNQQAQSAQLPGSMPATSHTSPTGGPTYQNQGQQDAGFRQTYTNGTGGHPPTAPQPTYYPAPFASTSYQTSPGAPAPSAMGATGYNQFSQAPQGYGSPSGSMQNGNLNSGPGYQGRYPPPSGQFPPAPPGGFNSFPPAPAGAGTNGPMMSNMPPPAPGPQFPGSGVGPGSALGPGGQPLAFDPSANRNAAAAAPKLTNEILPSVIDVLERDRQFNSGIYESRLNPILPPLVSTQARTLDCGNSVPQLLRSSLYVAPCTANLLKDSGVPFVLHMQPMAELAVDAPPIPLVYHGEKGPVRCSRCKAYMSPYMKFVEGGKKFQCPFCLISTEVPQDYFAYLDSEGRRVDLMQRPELCLGTYEYLATKEYCRNEKLPSPPAFIFMIDVSYRAISSGMVAQVCQMLRDELHSLLPLEGSGQESKLRIGIATFSDSVHFFNLKAGLKQPSMMTVNDFTDMFVPLVDGFLVRLEESGQMVDKLLEEIPKIFADARQVDTILYPVVQAGMRALEAAGCAGKLFVFNFSLPVFEAPGKLKNRDNRDILGTDKEKTILKPQIPDYTDLAKECVGVGCSVDLFLFPNSYIDVATLSEVSRLTGGQIYKYAYFTADKDGHRFLWDLRRNLKRSIAFDAVLRVRTSAGIRPTDYFGNMSMPTTTEVNLASIDSDKVILAEIKHDDKLEEKTVVHIQVALLYTSLSAERRVRVLNMALMSSNEYPELFRTAEIDVIMNFMMKNSVKGLYEFSPAAIREGLTERSTKMLAAYRNHCSNKNMAGQLVLPETLKLLPLYTGCLIRNDIVSGLGSEVGADDRSWLINHVNSLSVEHSTTFLYPRLFVLNEPSDLNAPDGVERHSFRQVRSSCQNMRMDQAYLLENGVAMFVWLGSQVDPAWLEDVFGVANVAQIDIEKGEAALSPQKNANADELRRFINLTRNSRPIYMRLMITRQGDKMESWFRRFLVEDQGATSFQQSYVQYIYYLHNAIRDEIEK